MISIILGQIMAQNKHFENGQILILKKCFWHYQLKNWEILPDLMGKL